MIRTWLSNVIQRAAHGVVRNRYVAIDVARGWAMVLMIFRHVWALLLVRGQVDQHTGSLDWWVCLICRPGVPLFFMSFGFMLSYVYRDQTPAQLRRRLLLRAVQVVMVYKLMYLCEMLVVHASWSAVLQGLLYQRVSITVEVLNFYFFMLLLAPSMLPRWQKLPVVQQVGVMVALGVATQVGRLDDWTHPVLQALLVGRGGMETFELLPNAITFLVGVTLGHRCRSWTDTRAAERECLSWAMLFFTAFLVLFEGHWNVFNDAIVFYGWKHPVMLSYLCFVTGGGCLMVALTLAWKGTRVGPGSRNSLLEVLGRHALMVYFFHWMVIYLYTATLGWLHQATPWQARGWAVALVVCCWMWARAQESVVAWLAPRVAHV